MGKCLYGTRLKHHWYFPLNEVGKNACSCVLHSEFVTQVNSENAGVFRRGRRFAKHDYLIPHICPSVRPHGTATLPLDVFSRNLIFETFFFGGGGNLSREITFQSNLTRIAGTLYEDLCTCMKTPRWMLLKMFHTKVEEENQNKHFMFNNSFLKIVPFMR